MAISHATEEHLWNWMGKAVQELVPPASRAEFITAVRPNVLYPQEALHWAVVLFTDELTLQTDAQAVLTEAGTTFFQQALKALEETQADYQKLVAQLKQATGTKGKTLFMPLRAALTGETHGPEMVHLLPLMGIARARQRLQQAMNG